MPAPEVLLACARPADVQRRDLDELARLLTEDERERARRFRVEADRDSYVLAHALVRALAAAQTGLALPEIELVHDIKGKPFIAQAPELHVSLSGTRDAVACAVTRAAPVGVDIERIDAKPADAGLLGAFVVTHDAVTSRQFFFHWTALEAFWKACGTGLDDANPRIFCAPVTASRFDVHVEHSSGACAGRGAVVNAYPDCALALVLCAPVEPGFVLKRTHCASAAEIRQLSKAHEKFCVA